MCRWATPPRCLLPAPFPSQPEAKVFAPPRAQDGGFPPRSCLPPNTASGLHPSLGMLEILYFLGFLPLFSDPRPSGSPWALPIVGAYYLVSG